MIAAALPGAVFADEVDALGTRALLIEQQGGGLIAERADAVDPFDIYFTERYSYEDNLFRVPDSQALDATSTPLVESLDDYVNRASVGVQLRLDASRQVFMTHLRIDDVRYQHNDQLNHRSGSGSLDWNFQVGSNWSGRINGRYDRTLASFSNYRLFVRDVVDAATYNGEVRYAIGSRWAVLAGANLVEADHSAAVREIDNFKSETARAGIQYRTPAGSSFGVDYRDTSARFPNADSVPGAVPYKYDERQSGLNAAYVYSAITQANLRVAYLDRDYADASLGDYSGTIWDAGVHWAPRTKLYFDLKGWRKLTAYSDAESDYFISDGGSITPTWEPTSTITLSAALSYEKQEYLGDSLLEASDDRSDTVSAALFGIGYAPRDFLTLALAYRWIDRESNREFRGYDASVVMAQVRVTL